MDNRFKPIPNLDDAVNDAILKSELRGGTQLDKLRVGARVEVQTLNTCYVIENREDGLYISGNAKYCPEPTKVYIPGSTFGGSMLKLNFVGPGMYMEYILPNGKTVTTSQIQEVREPVILK
jgi:hypothetical protein